MRKALWLQLLTGSHPGPTRSPSEELARYRKLRYASRQTPERAKQEQLYRERVRQWLQQPENKWCRVYLLLSANHVPATQCHHYQGRRGMLLLYEPYWIPVSWEGHRWVEDHPKHARELGLLCPAGRYNSPVRTRAG